MFLLRPYFTLFIPILLAPHAPAQTQTETILKDFGYFPQGLSPCGTVIRDGAGDLYGTTLTGGTTNNGVVFERSAAGTYTVLYSFKGEPDGALPNAGVSEDAVGNLYGTTTAGGAYNRGTIYKLTPGGVETVLYSFAGGGDGANIYGGATVDAAGNLYGTAARGGSVNIGTVWEFSAVGQFTVVHDFGSVTADGEYPDAGVILDGQGNLYGTTSLGGASYMGSVYKLSPGGTFTLLHSFTESPQTNPESGLAMDSAGNLYGAVLGAAYEVSADGAYTQFNLPAAANVGVTGAPALDGQGNLYVVSGGDPDSSQYGAIFQVNVASGQASTLYAFPGPPDKGTPVAGGNCPEGQGTAPGVVTDATGNIYGSSEYLGLGGGIFQIGASTSAESTLYRFPAAPGGSGPFQIARSSQGIVGLTREGGQWNGGILFELASSGERVVTLPFSEIGTGFGEDARGNFYVCGGPTEQQSDALYKITLSGESTLLYTFTDGSSCFGVTADAKGNVYGISKGGSVPQAQVFRLSNTGEFASLHVFRGDSEGNDLSNELTLDRQGNVYGTTFSGGNGEGVIFRVSPEGTETVLHNFTSAIGSEPSGGGLALDGNGNIYGTTFGGGPNSQGVLYELTASGVYKVLYAFVGGEQGGSPTTGVALDEAGDLYGTTSEGGDLSCAPPGGGPPVGCGVVFEFTAAGSYLVLHAFTGGAYDGAVPSSAPVVDGDNNVYGATANGGPENDGAVYEIAPEFPGRPALGNAANSRSH